MKSKRTLLLLSVLLSISLLFLHIGCKKEDLEKYNIFTDPRDGQTYQTIQIGNQVWMAENLNYDAGIGSWVYISAYTYGRLYDWETACNVCPYGWHLPTDDEWKTLEMYLGMSQADANLTGWRGTDEGGKLKETGTIDWCSPNTGATNESGFSALPGGFFNNLHRYCDGQGWRGSFWSSTEYDSGNAWGRKLGCDLSEVGRNGYGKGNGFSVRCVRD